MAKSNKELSKQCNGILYRQYSRQRYNKLKHQFPRMRQSQIVSKIIRDWETFSSFDKFQLYRDYVDRKLIHQQRRSEKSESSYEKRLEKTGEKKEEPLFEEHSSSSEERSHRRIIQSQSEEVGLKQHTEVKQRAQVKAKEQLKIQIQQTPVSLKTKLIKKKLPSNQVKNSEYINFFKYHYQKLNSEHSKWNSRQISHIVRLLWKKRCQKMRGVKKMDESPQKKHQFTPKSGKTAFVQHYKKQGLEKEQINMNWKRLPRQSKLLWEKRGHNDGNLIEPKQHICTVKLGRLIQISDENTQVFSFLKNKMSK